MIATQSPLYGSKLMTEDVGMFKFLFNLFAMFEEEPAKPEDAEKKEAPEPEEDADSDDDKDAKEDETSEEDTEDDSDEDGDGEVDSKKLKEQNADLSRKFEESQKALTAMQKRIDQITGTNYKLKAQIESAQEQSVSTKIRQLRSDVSKYEKMVKEAEEVEDTKSLKNALIALKQAESDLAAIEYYEKETSEKSKKENSKTFFTTFDRIANKYPELVKDGKIDESNAIIKAMTAKIGENHKPSSTIVSVDGNPISINPDYDFPYGMELAFLRAKEEVGETELSSLRFENAKLKKQIKKLKGNSLDPATGGSGGVKSSSGSLEAIQQKMLAAEESGDIAAAMNLRREKEALLEKQKDKK